MRDELHLIELADRYLRGELNEADRKAFGERLQASPKLRELVEDLRVLQQGIERMALRPAVDLAYRSYRFGKWMPGIGGAVIVAVVSVGGWMVSQSGVEHATAVLSYADNISIDNTITLSDTTDAAPVTVSAADAAWDTIVVQHVERAKVDTTIAPSVGIAAQVSTGSIERVTHDPTPRRIVEALTEKLDSQPMFVGGNEALRNYLLTNLRYPPQAEARDVQGRVTISFVILGDGSVYDARIISGIGSGCDEEALRVIQAMPKWIPGYLDGRPVGVRTTMPIIFRSSPPIMY